MPDKVPDPGSRHVVGVVQARLGSSRLPRKVAADFGGLPLVVHIAFRLRSFAGIDEVIVTTSEDPSDDDLVELCARHGLRCSRGPVDDIVERLLRAGRATSATHVARVWGDCPFIAPELFVAGLAAVEREGAGLATAGGPDVRTWPVGADVELWDMELLSEIASGDDRYREFPYEYARSESNRRPIAIIPYERPLGELYMTIDYPEDLEAARRILAGLGEPGGSAFLFADVVGLLSRQPDLVTGFSANPRNIEYKVYLAQRAAGKTA